jgi:hypothetical protein
VRRLPKHALRQDVAPSVSDNIFDVLPTVSAAAKVTPRNELNHYLTAPTEATRDPLLWWVEKQKTYPRLSRMARDYISVPATSVDVKRVFSKGRLLLSHVHNRLSVQSTQALLYLSNWSKAGLVKKEDIQHATLLPAVKEGEGSDDELEL